jgi:hypothetical protein
LGKYHVESSTIRTDDHDSDLDELLYYITGASALAFCAHSYSVIYVPLGMRRAAYGVWRRGRGRGLAYSAQRNYTDLASPPSSIHPPVRITTLPNKIRVATDSGPGHFASVGLYVDTGSRFETGDSLGASNFLDRMAFKVRTTFNPALASSELALEHPQTD